MADDLYRRWDEAAHENLLLKQQVADLKKQLARALHDADVCRRASVKSYWDHSNAEGNLYERGWFKAYEQGVNDARAQMNNRD